MDPPDPDHLQRRALGIRPDPIDKEISSWASLLEPDFAGKAVILRA